MMGRAHRARPIANTEHYLVQGRDPLGRGLLFKYILNTVSF